MMTLFLKRFDKWLDSHLMLWCLILLVVVLRIPNLFEPYWYGDEGIYLTIGNGLKQGLKLYSQIIDHKTPLIYYLAMVPNQMWFRILNMGWMVASTALFYQLGLRWLRSQRWAVLATLIFIIFTTLPWLEGNIPNGELFVLGFVLTGTFLLSYTRFFGEYFGLKTIKSRLGQRGALLGAGLFFGLAILTKVPALFDLVALGSLWWFGLINNFSAWSHLKPHQALIKLADFLSSGLMVLYGSLIPILASIVYFSLKGSGQAYLDFGFLYNFRYAQSWQIENVSQMVSFFFTLPGKTVLLALLMGLLSAGKKFFTPLFQFLLAWFGLTLFASLLSNRPYPHYFIQLIPSASLLIAYLLKNWRQPLSKMLPQMTLSASVLAILIFTIVKLNVGFYPTWSYYTRFYQLVTRQLSPEQYHQSFNELMHDNTLASELIRKSGSQTLFIWGTNPMLYALSGTRPSGRFTVSFHIKDFDAYQETLDDLKTDQPKYIVVMDNEDQPFPEFFSYLEGHYMPHSNFSHFTLWQKISPSL